MAMIKQIIFTGWNFMRWLRLLFGIFLTIDGIQSSNAFLIIFGVFLLIIALSNTGCCSASYCATPYPKKNKKENKEVSFEELKDK